MAIFPIVKRKGIERPTITDDNGHVTRPATYVTKGTVLFIYDAMTASIGIAVPYQTRLNRLPGPPVDSEWNFTPMAQWDPANWQSHTHPARD